MYLGVMILAGQGQAVLPGHPGLRLSCECLPHIHPNSSAQGFPGGASGDGFF